MSAPSAVASEPSAKERHGRVGVYALFQLRDYLLDRGLPTLIVGTLFGYVTLAPMLPSLHRNLETLPPGLIAKWGGVEAARAVLMHDFNAMFLRGMLGVIVYLGALLAMNGFVATDRKQGYYRFLFAKPVLPSRFYGQAFLVHWAGFVAIALLLAAAYGVLVWPILSLPLVYAITIMFLLYAGIVFALSAAFRSDWLLLLGVTVLASFLWDRYGESTSLAAKLLYLLPPLHRTTDIYTAVAKGEPLDWTLLRWFAAYGTACVIAGLVIVRHRRMAVL